MPRLASNANVADHCEARRLQWTSFHIPLKSAMIGTLFVVIVGSTVLTLWGYGPAGPIPYSEEFA
jgi:hypothetical protein